MGWIGRVLEFTRVQSGSAKVSDVKAQRGGGDIRTPQHFAPPGDDSQPLAGDYLHAEDQTGTGRDSVVGYVDPNLEGLAGPGEKRIYARNSSGDVVVSLWLKADGSAILSNDNGGITLNTDGSVDINGATITTGGDVLTDSNVSLDNHTHTQPNDSGGNTEQPTAPPTPEP